MNGLGSVNGAGIYWPRFLTLFMRINLLAGFDRLTTSGIKLTTNDIQFNTIRAQSTRFQNRIKNGKCYLFTACQVLRQAAHLTCAIQGGLIIARGPSLTAQLGINLTFLLAFAF